MARPQKNNADYFPHDANMRDDRKVKALRTRYGLTGYAIWCIMLEMLTDADNFILQWDDINIELIAGDIGIETQTLTEIVEYMRRVSLIEIDENKKMYTIRHQQRMAPILETRERKRQWKLENEAKATSKTPTKQISDVYNAQSKVKESKVKESKVKESKVEGEFNARAHESQNEQSNQKPLPDQLCAAITQWAETDTGVEILKAWKRDAGYSDRVHGPTTAELRKYIAHHLKGPQRDRLISDPVTHFTEQFPGWLANATQFNRKNNTSATAPQKPKYEPFTRRSPREGGRNNNGNATTVAHIGDITGKIITGI